MVNESKNIIQCFGTKKPVLKKVFKEGRSPLKEKTACHFVGRVAGNKVVRAAVSVAGFASMYSVRQAAQGAAHLCRCDDPRFVSGRMPLQRCATVCKVKGMQA